MSFHCTSPDCCAPESKKGKIYPAAMECPFCDEPLTAISNLNEEEKHLLAALPYVIAYPLQRTLEEQNPWKKMNLFKDTFLNYLKYLGLLTASEFFNSTLKDKNMVALFQQSLAEPSFGTWNQYIRETIKFLQHHQHPFFCPELVTYYEKIETGNRRKLYKGEIEILDAHGDLLIQKQEATGIGMLINFRNRYLGHGLTLDDGPASELWKEYYPIFRSLLQEMTFPQDYLMYKNEHGEMVQLHSSEIKTVEHRAPGPSSVWMENKEGKIFEILPFYIVPGEVSLDKADKEQIFTYESYTGKTIKFFSPEGTEKRTSGKILERLNLLIRDKQTEIHFQPKDFTREVFLQRIAAENKLIYETLCTEKKVIPGVYVHRQEMELKLKEWIGSRANILFIAAEAGSGKTNLLVEMQQQYAERNCASLLIRTSRMEKPTLHQQLAYLLNLDESLGLKAYPSLAGTQSHPFFILLDGLNEASKAEEIWQEVGEICSSFEPGCIKFVMTCRANSSADINRYPLLSSQENWMYGEKKEQNEGLSAFTHWLTALSMEEMKECWGNYQQKDKNRFKPLFSFDDLAVYDRGLYQTISNPLVLRLFLETYHGKNLPKKGKHPLHVWKDWLATFSEEEQSFMKLLATTLWEIGENELLLEDAFNRPELAPFLTTDRINAAYPRLKNLGWISRYTKDLNACIGFTVEGALFYLLGLHLQEQPEKVNLTWAMELVKAKNKLRVAGLEEFLCLNAQLGDLSLVTELIDAEEENHPVCVHPLLVYLKTHGAAETLTTVLANPTDHDWKVLWLLNQKMEELVEATRRKEFLETLLPLLKFETKESLWLGIEAGQLIEKEKFEPHLPQLTVAGEKFDDDADTLLLLGDINDYFGKYDQAIHYYEKSFQIRLNSYGKNHPSLANYCIKLGTVLNAIAEYDQATQYYEISLQINLDFHGENHPSTATSYNKLGSVWKEKGEYDQAIQYHEKSLQINLKFHGENHPATADTYHYLGMDWGSKKDYDQAIHYYEKSLQIRLNSYGENHSSLAYLYNNLGTLWNEQGEYDQAIQYLEKSLQIYLQFQGENHPVTASAYINLGSAWKEIGEYDQAIQYYEKSLQINLHIHGENHPVTGISLYNMGLLWLDKGELAKSNDFFQLAYQIFKKKLGEEHSYTKYVLWYLEKLN